MRLLMRVEAYSSSLSLTALEAGKVNGKTELQNAVPTEQ